MKLGYLSLSLAFAASQAFVAPAFADEPAKPENRLQLTLSASGASDPFAPEQLTFHFNVTSKCYDDVKVALEKHAALSNELQKDLKALGTPKSSHPDVSDYVEHTRAGQQVCQNTFRVSQTITLVTKDVSREAVVKAYGTLADSQKKAGVAGREGQPAVTASLPSVTKGLTTETFDKAQAQAMERAIVSLKKQKDVVVAACTLERVTKAPSMNWTVSKPNVPYPTGFAYGAAAPQAAPVANVDPEGIIVNASVTATYYHGDICAVAK